MAKEGSGINASDYNNFPEGFEFMELKGKETVILRLCKLRDRKEKWNPITKEMEKPTPNAAKRYRATDQILIGDDIVNVGYFKGTSPSGEAILAPMDLLFGSEGEIRLNPSKAQHRKIFKYMVHTNGCEDFIHRMTDQDPIFYIVNPAKAAQKKRDIRKVKMEAYAAVNSLSDDGVTALYSILGDGLTKSVEEMAEQLEVMAEDSPARVVAAIDSHLLPFEELAQKAVKGVKAVKHDQNKGEFLTPEGQVLVAYPKGRGSKPYTSFATELAKEGSVYATVKTLIDIAEKEAGKPKATAKKPTKSES